MSDSVPSLDRSKSLLKINAQFIALSHTICSISAFLAAFVLGYSLHFEKIVRNEYYGYPDEWFPSVSATIGDRYPERSIFQILIALTSGPRFLLLFFTYIRLFKSNSNWPIVGLITGIIRTVTCGGWVYITSTDDHDWHDIFMISYIVLTIPWNMSVVKLSPPRSNLRKNRKITSYLFFATLVPLIYLFVEHKINHSPGSYSYYAYCEWLLIVFDIGFDAWSIIDFKDLYLEIKISSQSMNMFSINLSESIDNSGYKNSSSNSNSQKNNASLFPKSNIFNSTYAQIILNILNSYFFWSILTSLFLCVWYFPLWFMGISGYELVILSCLSPITLKFTKFKNYCYKNPNNIKILAIFFGIGASFIPDPIFRLFSVSFGVAFEFISLSLDISIIGSNQIKTNSNILSYSITFILGLTLSSISKFAYWTNNPVWPILNSKTGGLNKIGFLIGLFSSYYTNLPNFENLINSNEKNQSQNQIQNKDKKNHQIKNCKDWWFTVLGFGSLLFSCLAMLTDSSTIILWTWSGYPINGPVPVPHGAITFTVMCLGIYSSLYNLSFIKNVTFLGIIGSILLYSFEGWIGFIGGMFYSFWLCYISPIYFKKISNYFENIESVMFSSILVMIILTLMHVWVVAYAFVPGGPILRERTDIVLFTSILLLLPTIYSKNSKIDKNDLIEDKKFNKNQNNLNIGKYLNIIISFLFLSYIIAFNRFQYNEPKPYHPKSRLVTTGIWTIHFGLDNDMWASEYRMRDLINLAELDVIGLLESDTERIIMGNRDLTQRIAEELGYYADFGPGPNKHTWGCALLSKFPIVNSTHYLLPSPVGELAPAIHATLNMYDTLVDIVVFHSGQEEDEEDRRLQSLKLQEIMGSSNRPMILLSYLVTEPLKGNYNTYVSEKSGMHDIDFTDDDRWCEYILYKNLKRTGYARISRGSITDTELQVGKFVVPLPDTVNQDYSNDKVPEVWINKDKRFPEIFNGEGINDHKYHVFEEPRYFV